METAVRPQVLIAGAGPVGLALAHELVRRDVSVRLVDAAPGPATTSRALAVHPRTMELYDQMGVVEAMLARGLRMSAFTLFQDGRRLARLDADYSTIPTRYPFTLAIEQTATEDVLRTALAARGVRPEWGVRLAGLEQGPDDVTVTLEHLDGRTETAVAPWVVGCDGGHSTVRKLLELPLIGESRQTWLLADVPMVTDLPPNSVYWIRARGGTMMAVPLEPRRWRLLDTVETDWDGDGDRLASRFAAKLRQGIGSPVMIGTPTWVSRFTAQQRMVPRMRSGRVFVAGDAAHVHSPASGQGMNTGVQEAVNLSWKLAMVIAGDAGPELLDSYGAERVPVGEQLLESTRKATEMIEMRTPFTDLALPVIFGVISRVRPARRRMQAKMLAGMSGLALSYADGPLTGDGAGEPRPGRRVTEVTREDLADPAWTALLSALRRPGWLLLTGEAPPRTPVPRWLTVLPIRSEAARTRLGLRDGAWILVRPDGYVLDRGTRLGPDTLGEALRPLHPRSESEPVR